LKVIGSDTVMVNFKVFGTKLRIYPQTAKFGFRVGLGSFGRFGEFWEIWEFWGLWEIWAWPD